MFGLEALNLSPEYASRVRAELVAELAEKLCVHQGHNAKRAFELAEYFIDYKGKYIESATTK
jgi:hypothetical protein